MGYGNRQKQRELLERVLCIKETHYGPNHLKVAIALSNLSDTYGVFGNLEKQRELLERALCIQETHYGPNHSKVAIILSNLSDVYDSSMHDLYHAVYR